MNDPPPYVQQGWEETVELCRQNRPFLAELQQLYSRVDSEVGARGAVCLGGGACCKFDLAGHRLYLSVGELALLTAEPPTRPERGRRRRCAYQQGPRCGARQRRPLGCRIFFCKDFPGLPAADLYERHHAQIRALHQRHCLPYAYVELTFAFSQLFGIK